MSLRSSERNIAIITPGFAISEADDFTIPALQEFIQGIKKYRPRWSVTIFTLHFPYTSVNYDYYGFKVIPFNGGNSKLKKPLIRLQLVKQFKKEHSKKSFDVIHSFWFSESTYLAQKLSLRFNIPLVCSCYGQDVLKDNPYLNKISTDTLQLVYSSKFQQEQSQIKTSNETSLIPCGIDSLEIDSSQKTIDIIAAGNLTILKNHLLFLDIVQQIVKTIPMLKTIIVGEGPLFNNLINEIKKRDLQNNVQLLGKQSRKKTLNLISQSKVFLHTSNYESFGLIFLEALQCACHVVSTPVGFSLEVDQIKTSSKSEELTSLVLEGLYKEPPLEINPSLISSVIDEYDDIYSSLNS